MSVQYDNATQLRCSMNGPLCASNHYHGIHGCLYKVNHTRKIRAMIAFTIFQNHSTNWDRLLFRFFLRLSVAEFSMYLIFSTFIQSNLCLMLITDRYHKKQRKHTSYSKQKLIVSLGACWVLDTTRSGSLGAHMPTER